MEVRQVMRWQRKMLAFAIMVIVVSLFLAIVACSPSEAEEAERDNLPERFQVTEYSNDSFWVHTVVITDTKEGCQYLLTYRQTGEGGAGGLVQLTDKYGYPLLAQGYSRNDVGVSDDDGE